MFFARLGVCLSVWLTGSRNMSVWFTRSQTVWFIGSKTVCLAHWISKCLVYWFSKCVCLAHWISDCLVHWFSNCVSGSLVLELCVLVLKLSVWLTGSRTVSICLFRMSFYQFICLLSSHSFRCVLGELYVMWYLISRPLLSISYSYSCFCLSFSFVPCWIVRDTEDALFFYIF